MILAVLLCTLDLAAAPPAAPPQPLTFVRASGRLQCEPDSGLSPEKARSALEALGLEVVDVKEGHDGLFRPALCGLPTGHVIQAELKSAPGEELRARLVAEGWAEKVKEEAAP